ncbi:lipid II:glycine glycyltransferase FemX [Natronoflexus pectinivorans]|uniref:Lipid II:glycine glycyltransferase (Peptidoglycan interpeptide bridge formation enzyme) n=1 Tax=Natronoflexus pectinivorans TaxID=682526 RepID=A0A4R2GF52_9BACT|nr:peptidoglycan bridge formation glycyltransferase FemA/FemB family protein [Natronoflexus pectinivorans]TCO06838.1 lipid II:glycine glycyltransferase (peptidoglycan interpeptide bridge formation enzyme) [Natronoflexus pectinivorans]
MNKKEKLKISTEICTSTPSPEWDQFASLMDGASYEQTSLWGDLKHWDGWKATRLIVKRDDEILCGTQIYTMDIPLFGKVGYISQGPCFSGNQVNGAVILLKEIKKFARKQKLRYLTIDIHYKLPRFIDIIKKNGFRRHPDYIPPNPNIKSTQVIDLRQTEEGILAGFKKNRRKSVKEGLKNPIQLKPGKREDIPLLFALVNKTCERIGVQSSYPDINYLYDLWDKMHPNGWVTMLIGEINGEVVSASLAFTFGNTFRDTIWGWSGEYSSANFSDAITWQLMLWAKENGFEFYDLVQLDDVSAKAILSGQEINQEIKNRVRFGATFYKMRFGGETIFYPGTYTWFSSPFIKWLLLFSSKYLIHNQIIRKTIRIIRKNRRKEKQVPV